MRITYGGVVVVMHLYSLGQCPELNFGHQENSYFCYVSRVFAPHWLAPHRKPPRN
jgi:hypothetical protein